jgi:hypothetical protein
MFFRGTRLTATARATTIAAGQKNFPRVLLGRPVLASAAIATSAITTGTAVVALCDGTSDKSVKVLTAELTKAIDTDALSADQRSALRELILAAKSASK